MQPCPGVGGRGAQRLAEVAPHDLSLRGAERSPPGRYRLDDAQPPPALGKAALGKAGALAHPPLPGEVVDDPAAIIQHNYWRDAAHYALARDEYVRQFGEPVEPPSPANM